MVKSFLFVCLLFFLGSINLFATQNLVINGGFETGNFPGWNTFPASGGSDFGVACGDFWYYSGPEHSGNCMAVFGAYGNESDSISQVIPTEPGHHYIFSFWAASVEACDHTPFDTPDYFYADWNSSQVFFTCGLGYSPFGPIWGQYSFTAATSTASTVITFGGISPEGFYFLDDVSVSQTTPEPSSMSLLVPGLLVLACAIGQKRF